MEEPPLMEEAPQVAGLARSEAPLSHPGAVYDGDRRTIDHGPGGS
jgi:hypothetical protein